MNKFKESILFLVIRENKGFSSVWCLTKEQVLEFFPVNQREKLESSFDKIDCYDISFIHVSGTERYLIRLNELPFYMQYPFKNTLQKVSN